MGEKGDQLTLGKFVGQLGTKVSLRAGQILFREGDESRCVYAVVSGRINLFITTPAGRDVMLGSKVPGQAFGELSVIDGGPRSATAVVMEPTTIAQLSGDEFLDQLARAPHLSIALLRELAEHLRVSNGRASARASDNLTARMAHLLLELAAKFRRHGGPVNPVELPITQDELAAWVGSTREAVSRSLSAMRKAGVIETGRNKIVLCDPQALSLLAQPSVYP
jgi:CRP/FNR family transcriptional regulator, cyclic AMP receptor protein